MSAALTPIQHKILHFIQSYVEEHGFPPSIRDVGSGVGLRAISSASYQLKRLEQGGHLRRDPRVRRGIVLTTGGHEHG